MNKNTKRRVLISVLIFVGIFILLASHGNATELSFETLDACTITVNVFNQTNPASSYNRLNNTISFLNSTNISVFIDSANRLRFDFNMSCEQITGSADLCDGNDASTAGATDGVISVFPRGNGINITNGSETFIGLNETYTDTKYLRIDNASYLNASTNLAGDVTGTYKATVVSNATWSDNSSGISCTQISGTTDDLCVDANSGGGGSSPFNSTNLFTFLNESTHSLILGNNTGTEKLVVIGNVSIDKSLFIKNGTVYDNGTINKSINLNLYNKSISLDNYNQSVDLSSYNRSISLDNYNQSISLDAYLRATNSSIALWNLSNGNTIYPRFVGNIVIGNGSPSTERLTILGNVSIINGNIYIQNATVIDNGTLNKSINLDAYNKSISLDTYNKSINLDSYNKSISLDTYNKSISLDTYPTTTKTLNFLINKSDANFTKVRAESVNASVVNASNFTGALHCSNLFGSDSDFCVDATGASEVDGVISVFPRGNYINVSNGSEAFIGANESHFDIRYQQEANAFKKGNISNNATWSSNTSGINCAQINGAADNFCVDADTGGGTALINGSDFTLKDGNITQNLTVGGNTLHVDSNNSRVGILTLLPSSTLEVSGDVELTNLLDNDGSDFFDESLCGASATVSTIDSTGLLDCITIDISESQISDLKAYLINGSDFSFKDGNITQNLTVIGNITANLITATNLSGQLNCNQLYGADADFCNDANTGGAGSSPFNSSGSNVYFNDTDSRLGLGTSTPNQKLVVIGNVNISGTLNLDSTANLTTVIVNPKNLSSNSLLFQVISQENEFALVVNGTRGRVGIGTSNPRSRLHVVGTDNITLRLEMGNVGREAKIIYDINGTTRWVNGYDSVTGNYHISEGGTLINNVTISLQNGSRRVGIGITNPVSTLHVKEDSDVAGEITIQSQIGQNTRLIFRNDSTDVWQLTNDVLLGGIQDVFKIRSMTGTATDRLVILQSGEIGIGTTSPTEVLTIAGNVSITGNLTVNNIFNLSATTGNANLMGILDAGDLRVDGNNVCLVKDAWNIASNDTTAWHARYAEVGFKRANVSEYLGGADVNASLLKIGNVSGFLQKEPDAFKKANDSQFNGTTQSYINPYSLTPVFIINATDGGTNGSLLITNSSVVDNTTKLLYVNNSIIWTTGTLNVTGKQRNTTFEGDVQIKGLLNGASPLKINGGTNITGNVTMSDGIIVNEDKAKPSCNVDIRGKLWVTYSALGVADVVEICVKTALDAYVWRVITLV